MSLASFQWVLAQVGQGLRVGQYQYLVGLEELVQFLALRPPAALEPLAARARAEQAGRATERPASISPAPGR